MFHSRTFARWAFLAPYLLGALLLVALPAALSFAVALTRYNGVSSPTFAGLKNFQALEQEPLFWVALNRSLIFIVMAVPLRIFGALILALLHNRPRRGTGLYRAVTALPTIIPDAPYALAWTWILNPLYGPLNAALRALGLPAPAWLVDSAWAIPALVLMSLFQIGEGFIILLAGLRHIPRELHDSARVDGANALQRFTYITLPLLAPWLALLSIRDATLSFQNTFTPAYLMTRGGPYYSTFFFTQLIYETAFDRMDFGQAAAILWIVFLVTILLVMLVYFLFEDGGFHEA